MSNLNSLGQIMPYLFSSTGSLPGVAANILSAPPLVLKKIQIPETDRSNNAYVNLEWKSGDRVVGTIVLDDMRCIMPLAWKTLCGEEERMCLWAVKVWNKRCEFYFFDHTERQIKHSGRSNVIKIEDCQNISLELSAATYAGQPARDFLCSYHLADHERYVELEERIEGDDSKFKLTIWPSSSSGSQAKAN